MLIKQRTKTMTIRITTMRLKIYVSVTQQSSLSSQQVQPPPPPPLPPPYQKLNTMLLQPSSEVKRDKMRRGVREK